MVQYLAQTVESGSFLRISEERESPVKRRSLTIGKDAAAQNFAAMFGVPRMLPGQDEMGYGSKITTNRQVKVGNRWFRVYATCFSNAASHWILKAGKKLFL